MNTPSALNVIRNLITQSNVYINQTSAGVDGLIVLGIATWISKMLRMFGLEQQDAARFGFAIESSPGRGTPVSSLAYCVRLFVSLSSQDNSAILPYLQALSSFRDDVRAIAKNKSPDMTRDLLVLCDKLRGDVLPPLGIQLSDRTGL